jgi:hypothetical protein
VCASGSGGFAANAEGFNRVLKRIHGQLALLRGLPDFEKRVEEMTAKAVKRFNERYVLCSHSIDVLFSYI